MARRTGAKTRSRIASETPLTMWQGGPYFSKAASQSVVMVTQETVVRSAEGWTTHLTVGLEWSRRITHFARVSKVFEETGNWHSEYNPISPAASEATSRARRTDGT